MHRHLFDRLTDTTTFRVLHFCAGLVVVPVLLFGVLGAGLALMALASPYGDSGMLVLVVPVVGGLLGIVGLARARSGARAPQRHNVPLTLVLLAFGVVTTLALAGDVIVEISPDALFAGRPGVGTLLSVLFALALLVWAVAGLGVGQRLVRAACERTGQPFDGIPTLLLFVALVLALSASLGIATL